MFNYIQIAAALILAVAALVAFSHIGLGKKRREAAQAAEKATTARLRLFEEEAWREAAQREAQREECRAGEKARRKKSLDARISELGDEACSNFRSWNAWSCDRTAYRTDEYIRRDRSAHASLARAKKLVVEMKQSGWVNPTAGSRWGELSDSEYICRNFGPRI